MMIGTTGTRNGIGPALLGLACLATAFGAAIAAPPALEARFQAELEQLVAEHGLPGATAAYVLADGTAGTAAAGLADVERDRPMHPHSRMLAASIGKTFVGAVMIALEHEGRLDLDDPLARWLGTRPWFSRLPNGEAITLRHLLRHESGLPNHVGDPAFLSAWQRRRADGDTPFPPEELIAFVLDREPLFPAGAGWSYSDTGYLLLGLVIETAAGCSYYDAATARFLEPLGLHATTPSDRIRLPGLATGYLAADNGLGLPVATTVRPGVMAWHPGLEWTGGGLVSTSGDLARWAWSLYGGRVLPAPSLAELLQARPIGDDPDGPAYGLGVSLRPEGPLGPTWGHGGWIPGYVSSLRYYPAADVAVAFQVNTDDGVPGPVGEAMETRLARIVLKDAGRPQN